MGIRFYCPNGHKLNVKEFQAGRRGICPFCGARIQIPMQSTRPGSKSAGRQGRSRDDANHGTGRPESAQASDSSPDILPGEPPSLPGDPAGGKMLGPSTPVGTPSAGGPVIAPPTLPAGALAVQPLGGPPRRDYGGPAAPAADHGHMVPVNLQPALARQPSPSPVQPAPVPSVPAPVVPATAAPGPGAPGDPPP